MSLEAALAYAAASWPVFPCNTKKLPLIKRWPDLASTDPDQIKRWWKQFPGAWVGTPTGRSFVVLDVDTKNSASGFDTLAELGFPFWFGTPTVHTRSGGAHAYFAAPAEPFRNTAGNKGRGIGDGLDWRGLGGLVILPSEGSGYEWDPHLGIDTPLAAVPPELLPKAPPAPKPAAKPVQPTVGLSPYAWGALNSAVRAILDARAGSQEETLNSESYSIGTLAGSGAIPADFARDSLFWAANQLISYDPRRPWRPGEAAGKARSAFDAGMRSPRRARRG
jgi:Bifunctional DNA primase/polymerase, N-terminal